MKKYIAALFLTCALALSACGAANTAGQTGANASTAAESAAWQAVESEAESKADKAEESSANTDTTGESSADAAAEADESSADAAKTDESPVDADDQIPNWTEDSEVMKSLTSYVADVCDESSENFVPEEDRIAVFDFDGTLYGELFPTYFNVWFFLDLVNHQNVYEPSEEVKEYAKASEEAYLNGEPQPEKGVSTSKEVAAAYAGKTVEEYQTDLRELLATPVWGFEGMTYAEGFYMPMVSVVKYLTEHGFTCFVVSATERTSVRETMRGSELEQYIPSYHVIGSSFALEATGQGDMGGQDYTITEDDQVVFGGTLDLKTKNTGKVFAIINEIGKTPVLAFGNSSGDLAMGLYTVQNGGKSYMLLCDDTERDYGNLEEAAKFAEDCAEMGLETVSMKDDFETIYKEGAVKTESVPAEEEVLAPAA